MKFALLFFALTIGSLALASPCAYYPQKSKQLGCDSSGYLMRFGYRYCAKFLREEHEYTPAGQKFMQAIRPCLIQSLEVKSHVNCRNVKAIAQKTHVRCYLKNGFCGLPDADKVRLFFTVWPEIVDPGFSAVMSEIQHTCDVR